MRPPPPAEIRAAAAAALAYLAAADPAPTTPVDAIIGFGVFDLRLPSFCGDLFRAGAAPRLIFTGGIGAGTGALGQPEADAWRDALRRTHPEINDAAVIRENRSTNTAENIAFTAALLAREHPALTLGVGLRTAIIVTSPSRLRRVRLTLRHLQPRLHAIGLLPPHTFEGEAHLYTAHGFDYLDHLAGELDRIVDYSARGWIAAEPLPPVIAAVRAQLRTFQQRGSSAP